MTPRRAEPFDAAAVRRIVRDRPEALEDVVKPHVAQPVQQAARVLEHDARVAALVDEPRYELPHALVAPVEHGRVVVVADVGVLHHVLQVADDPCRAQVVAAGRNQRLVHVQRLGEAARQRAHVHAASRQVEGPALGGRLGDRVLRAADVRQPVHLLGNLHGLVLRGVILLAPPPRRDGRAASSSRAVPPGGNRTAAVRILSGARRGSHAYLPNSAPQDGPPRTRTLAPVRSLPPKSTPFPRAQRGSSARISVCSDGDAARLPSKLRSWHPTPK